MDNRAKSSWPKVRDAAAFVVGVGLLSWQLLLSDAEPNLILTGIGVASLGITGASVTQRAIEKVIGE